MSMIYLPTADQMDETVDSLSKIAKALGSKVDVSSWENIRKAVKLGVAPEVLPIGTQLVASHSKYGDMVFDVVAHNYFKSVDDENAPTMTLLAHDCIEQLQFDNREAFYYAENGLSAGTYHFTIAEKHSNWAAGTYQFTLINHLPVGGQLCIESTNSLPGNKVISYASATTTTASESCVITEGSGGTYIGDFGVGNLNYIDRFYTGSNNYKESAIRQFLNSTAVAGMVWTPQTKFDRPPTWASNTPGFASGLDKEFLNAVGRVSVPCAANYRYEVPDSDIAIKEAYTVSDKFYLPSHNEIFGITSNSATDGSVIFPYYEGAVDSDRVKYRSGSSVAWWTRSANRWYGDTIEYVDNMGRRNVRNAYTAYGAAIACTIV